MAVLQEVASPEELAALNAKKAGFPTLRISYDEPEKRDDPPKGWWKLQLNGKTHYSETALLRPFVCVNQYQDVDFKNPKNSKFSIMFKSFKEEIPDTAGGFKCGKMSKEALEAADKATQEVQKNIKTTFCAFGLVTFPGVEDVQSVPAVYYAQKASYMAMSDIIREAKKGGKSEGQSVIQLSTTREKNGSVVYFNVNPKIIDTVNISADEIGVYNEFVRYVNEENKRIVTLHNKFAGDRPRESGFVDSSIDDILGDVSDNLELPED